MARLAASLGLVAALFGTAVHAESELPEETIAAAEKAGVDPTDLRGAEFTTGLDPWNYLYAIGALQPPRPKSLRDYAYDNYPATARCIERIAGVESGVDRAGNPTWFTRGWNPIPWGRFGEHASGLGGFLPSTWASTPEAAQSIWDGPAQVRAIDWMLRNKRGTEFAAVTWGRCHGLLGMY